MRQAAEMLVQSCLSLPVRVEATEATRKTGVEITHPSQSLHAGSLPSVGRWCGVRGNRLDNHPKVVRWTDPNHEPRDSQPMTFKIDSDIPIPAASRGPHPIAPWSQLQVGKNNSVFLPGTKIRNVSSCAATWAYRHPGTYFTCRTVTENGVKGVRVWRISAEEHVARAQVARQPRRNMGRAE